MLSSQLRVCARGLCYNIKDQDYWMRSIDAKFSDEVPRWACATTCCAVHSSAHDVVSFRCAREVYVTSARRDNIAMLCCVRLTSPQAKRSASRRCI